MTSAWTMEASKSGCPRAKWMRVAVSHVVSHILRSNEAHLVHKLHMKIFRHHYKYFPTSEWCRKKNFPIFRFVMAPTSTPVGSYSVKVYLRAASRLRSVFGGLTKDHKSLKLGVWDHFMLVTRHFEEMWSFHTLCRTFCEHDEAHLVHKF